METNTSLSGRTKQKPPQESMYKQRPETEYKPLVDVMGVSCGKCGKELSKISQVVASNLFDPNCFKGTLACGCLASVGLKVYPLPNNPCFETEKKELPTINDVLGILKEE